MLDGNLRGSDSFTDELFIRNGAFTLTHDVLQNFEATVQSSANLTFDGSRTIDGNVTSDGGLTFDVADTQTVTGDLTLSTGSSVTVNDATGVGADGSSFTLCLLYTSPSPRDRG